MDEQILGEDQIFEESIDIEMNSPEDIFFGEIVMQLQQIIVDQEFQKTQAGFMRHYCHAFQTSEQNKIQYMQIFQQYQQNISLYLQQKLGQKVKDFSMQKFTEMLPTRTNQIDEQIYQILTSFTDYQIFKQMMIDYKISQEQQERYRILTIKSTKMPETKKVKSNVQNIFANSQPLNLGGGDLLKKKNAPKKKEKSQQQILIPELVLTVRPLKKG